MNHPAVRPGPGEYVPGTTGALTGVPKIGDPRPAVVSAHQAVMLELLAARQLAPGTGRSDVGFGMMTPTTARRGNAPEGQRTPSVGIAHASARMRRLDPSETTLARHGRRYRPTRSLPCPRR